MTLQNLDFSFEKGVLAGPSPLLVGRESLLDTVLDLSGLSSIINRDPVDDSILADAEADLDASRFYADPVAHPPHLSLSIRAVAATENTLQRLVASEGLTFWGEAASLIFDLCALNPGFADLNDLERAPRGLTRHMVTVRFRSAETARRIQVPLSKMGLEWIEGVARAKGIGVERAASLVLYRNATAAVATIQAARAAE